MGNCCAPIKKDPSEGVRDIIRKPPTNQATIEEEKPNQQPAVSPAAIEEETLPSQDASKPITSSRGLKITTPRQQQQQQQVQTLQAISQVQSTPKSSGKKVQVKLDLRFQSKQSTQVLKFADQLPVQKPFCLSNDFEKVLLRYRTSQQAQVKNKYVSSDLGGLSDSLLEIRNRNWIQDLVQAHQQYIQTLNGSSFDSLVKHKRMIQLQEQFHWLVWAVAYQYFIAGSVQKLLPRHDSPQWSEGFQFKGLFVQLLPIEDASHVLDEMKALSQVQIELMQVLARQDQRTKLPMQMIIPLMAVVKCGAFCIYATPLIYAQDVQCTRQSGFPLENQPEVLRLSSTATAKTIMDFSQFLPSGNHRSSLSYLHQEKQNKTEASLFYKMPVLRNLQASNLIPVMDFEKIQTNPSQQPDINYLVTNVRDCLCTLSSVATSNQLFIIPCSNEEIIIKKFPESSELELSKVQKYLMAISNSGAAIGSMKPKGDINVSPSESLSEKVQVAEQANSLNFSDIQTKITQKNGWDLMFIQADAALNWSSNRQAENKRATQLITSSKLQLSRENMAPAQQTAFQTKRLNDKMLFSPKQSYTPSPLTAVKQEKDESMYGPCIVSAQLQKGFKILPALSLIAYPTGIETLIQTSIEQVAQQLNQKSEQTLNIRALKELMHRKGLNMRFLWLLLAKVTLKKSRELVLISLMLRVMRRVVFSKVTSKQFVSSTFSYNGSSQETFKESVAMFVNALLKNKFAKYRAVFDETLISIFLHRLKVLSLAFTLRLSQAELNYLESRDILDAVLEAPSNSPTLFLNSVQTYFNVQLTANFNRAYHQDCYVLLIKSQPLTINDYRSVSMQVVPVLNLRDLAYFLLASRCSRDNQKQLEQPSDTQQDTARHKYKAQSIKQRPETYRKFSNLDASINKSFKLIDLSRKRAMPSCELKLPSILYKMGPQTSDQLQSSYELPSIDQFNEWVIVLDSMFKDCFSICYDSSDQVLVEALCIQALTTFFIQDDSEAVFKILTRIRQVLEESISMAPEIISMISLIQGLWSDSQSEIDLVDSERNYLASLIALMSVLGDPRGRGNSGVPLMMLTAWKLQILAMAGKKTQDAELAEEMFDACLHGFLNYRKMFREQTFQVVQAQEKAYKETERSQVVQNTALDISDSGKNNFDLKQYRVRPNNVLTAGGFLKSSVQQKLKLNELRGSSVNKQRQASQISHLQKKNGDADLSDIEIIMPGDHEADFSKLSTQFVDEAQSIPFPHWMINRQVFQQQVKSVAREKAAEQKEMLSQFVRETLNSLHPQDLLVWLITNSPMQFTSGLQWDSQTTKDFCFGSNNNLFQSSSSSVSYSQSGRSLNSSRFEGPQTSRKRHLASYTQIFGKEVGGIQKTEVAGLVQIWGTDSSGQLGLDHYCPQQKQSISANQNLKLLHPRICIPLKNEVIREICCGYGFTFAINHLGHTYCWGSNECGQLGLGPDSMSNPIIRSPQLNPYLSGVTRICAGNEHAMALTKSGDLYSWGSAMLTGFNDKEHRPIPTILEELSGNCVKYISCGGLHSMALTKQGNVYTWGSNEGGQLGLRANSEGATKPSLVEALSENKQFVIQIAGGETHTIALTREHKIWGWGMSMYGQLGLGFSADSFEPGLGLSKSKVLNPVEVTPFLPPNTDVVQVYCGAAFTLLQTKEGELYGCGINDLGQLGLDTYLEDIQLAMIDRSLKNNEQAQMSSDVTVPSKVICFEKMNVQTVVCGENHSLAVIGEDKSMLWSWGMYKNGQLGLGEVTMKMNPRPIQTLCAGHINSIAAGSQHSVALLGEQSQLSALTNHYFQNADVLNNFWNVDFRALDRKLKVNSSMTNAKRSK